MAKIWMLGERSAHKGREARSRSLKTLYWGGRNPKIRATGKKMRRTVHAPDARGSQRVIITTLRAWIGSKLNPNGKSQVKQHPEKTFIGRTEPGFVFLGYQMNATGLTGVAPPTVERFVRRVHRLYEQGAIACLGEYVRRWLVWVRSGLSLHTSELCEVKEQICGGRDGDSQFLRFAFATSTDPHAGCDKCIFAQTLEKVDPTGSGALKKEPRQRNSWWNFPSGKAPKL